MLYCSQSVAAQKNMTDIANAGYRLWVAQYANYNPMYAFTDNPWSKGGVAPFSCADMRQYTSMMYLPGWKGRLDADLFSGDEAGWRVLCDKSVAPTPAPAKTIDDIAQEVINGKWVNPLLT